MIVVIMEKYVMQLCVYLWPILLTWINFNPSMDK